MQFRIRREKLINSLSEAIRNSQPGDIILLPDTLSERFTQQLVASIQKALGDKAVSIDFYRAPRRYILPKLNYLNYLKDTVLPELSAEDTIVVTAPSLSPKKMQEILTRFVPGIVPNVTFDYEELTIG